jgi:signal transduction histidine kinase
MQAIEPDIEQERLALSILQELTVAALDLFDPERSMSWFLERLAERMGCLAVLVLGARPPDGTRLLAAAGLSASSCPLPLATDGSGSLPYPELARPGLQLWRFSLAEGPEDSGASELVLCFERPPVPELQYRGMMRRLAKIFQTALTHRQLFERAQRATRAREELIAVVSHDLKGPLTNIMLNTEGLLGGHPTVALAPELRPALERIRRATQRMTRLTTDLLDLARLEAGHLAIDPDTHELAALMSDAVEPFAGVAAGKSQQLRQTVAAGAGRARCDRERVVQVIANLVGNAVKFTPAGGAITVRADRGAEGEIIVSVTDTGPGIDEQHQAHIFDRFWQADEGARRGTGLGLSIAKALVELHGGRIWVASRPGAGSTFSFTLPPG